MAKKDFSSIANPALQFISTQDAEPIFRVVSEFRFLASVNNLIHELLEKAVK